MLDQYRQDLNSENDHLGEGRFQMSRRKVVFTLAGAALALLFFLFLIGAFRTEEEVTSERDTTGAVASELIDLQARVEKLEQLLQGTSYMATKTQNPDTNSIPLSDNSLKQLIATTAGDEPESSQAFTNDPVDIPQADGSQINAPLTPAAEAKPAPRMYVIQKGDTLSKISQKYYGTTKKWKIIYDANRDRINNINNLKVGTQIVIPEDSSK